MLSLSLLNAIAHLYTTPLVIPEQNSEETLPIYITLFTMRFAKNLNLLFSFIVADTHF